MPDHPLYIAFIWHMHQPFYRDMLTGEIALPWVRLHAAKDYLHMAEVLARHPGVHVTINAVPSLVEQILAWAAEKEADILVTLAERETWSDAEKRTILSLCYSVNWAKIIRRYPRYSSLLDRRPQAQADLSAFTPADYRDLIGWFNLAWIDPGWLEHDAELAALVAKGQGFTVADLRLIHAKQREIAASVLPLYRKLVAEGQLEVSTTPFYHPILPLLADTNTAQRAAPGLPQPEPPFIAPEDAAAQLQLAIEAHTAHFGAPPAGLWPSEGAVSPEILPLVRAAGFRWLATDEAILGRSLGRALNRDAGALITEPAILYRPYRVLAGGELGPSIIFRDHDLSDRIGFIYQHLPGKQAAEDMIYRLLDIRRRLNDPGTPYLVSIILDGENCWEHYEHNGDIFLDALYEGLATQPELRAVTVSEYLSAPEQRPAAILARLATGSWIGGDLTTWIGDPEHNRAWEALGRTRAHLLAAQDASPDRSGLRDAWRALYAAEGSDWFWWYSHRNSSQQDAVFDRLFRHDLSAAYTALGDEAPADLAEPIHRGAAAGDRRPATGYVTPRLVASPYPGETWAAAGLLKPASASTGAMQRAESEIEQLLIGHDTHALYLRLDLRERLDKYDVAIYLCGATCDSANQRPRARYADPDQAPANLALGWAIVSHHDQPEPFLFRAGGQETWISVSPVTSARGERVLEVSVPLATLGLALDSSVRMLATLARDGVILAQVPEHEMGVLTLTAFS